MRAGRAAAPKLEPLLLQRIQQRQPRLEELLAEADCAYGIEDGFYRFYCESFKLENTKSLTRLLVEELRNLLPERELNPWFTAIVAEGTRLERAQGLDDVWFASQRPVLEAFFHAHLFLKLALAAGREFSKPPMPMSSGWAALMCLYEMR